MDVNSFLASGAPAAKFEKIGDKVGGVIVDAQLREQTDIKTSATKFYSDGNPMMQVVITLQTGQNDPSIEDDDGRRRIYARGQMLTALRKACGKTGLQVGGKLAVKYEDNGEAKQKGFNAPKLYKVRYEPPPDEIVFSDSEQPDEEDFE